MAGRLLARPVEVRPAEPGDADEVAAVHVRSWQVAYRGLMPQDYLDGLRAEDRAARYTFGAEGADAPATAVAVVDGAICGFVTTAPARDDDVQGDGELSALYVDPASWGLGVGRTLMSAARDQLSDGGFTEVVLWVLVGNERAERFYRIDGWTPDGARRWYTVWGAHVDEVRYRRPLP
jgi:GNAT superfamily N-acetyltransferase